MPFINMDKLPVFEMVIDPNETSDVEVSFIALVDKPAIERNFLAFNSLKLDFAIDKEQRILSGPAMVAETPIYRRDDSGEYNVFFSKPTIKEIALKFFKKGYNKNLNLFHDANLPADGATIFESFVSDKERGIPPMKGFEDLPDGSWFVSVKIENDEIWNRIKSGEVKGFSVEGIFSYVKQNVTQKHSDHLSVNDLMSQLKELINKAKEAFLGGGSPAPAQPEKLAQEYTLKDGTVVEVDNLAVGGVVTIGGVPAPAGVHEFADGTKVSVGEGGVIEAIETMQAPEAPPTDYSSQFAAIDEKFSAYELKFQEMATKAGEFAQALEKQNQTITQLLDIVEKLSDTPTADPVTENKNGFSTQKVQDKDAKRKELAGLFANIKKNKNK